VSGSDAPDFFVPGENSPNPHFLEL
jgi:hypothetical protein